jgi:nickel-type superoxide dismutase maturation protease
VFLRAVRSCRPWWPVVATVAAVYVAVLAVNRSLVVVRGPSMRPTFRDGDRLLTLPARPGWVRPGQVVVVENPSDSTHLVVKRVVTAGAGRVEVLGDDLDASTDSRAWGPVPARSVRRIGWRAWPDVRTRLRRHPA